MRVDGLENEMVRVYMFLWPCCMIFLFGLVVFTLFLYEWNPVRGAPSSVSQSPPHWMEDHESFDPMKFNYGVIVDAGSSGSRVFVYVWPPHTGKPQDLIQLRPLLDSSKNPVVKKVSPGLSTFGENPENATLHMKFLLDYAAGHIPQGKHSETSLFIMATAGLRLLPENQREAILSNLRTELPKLYEFIIMDQHIEMITGKWEGIYSWIAVNYVLNRFEHTDTGDKDSTILLYDKENNRTLRRQKTVGMLDMGGGSMQIALELTEGWERVPPNQEHLITKVNLGCSEHDTEHEYRLYVTTFLGFGANMAMSNYEKMLRKRAEEMGAKNPAETSITLDDPCLNVDMSKGVQSTAPSPEGGTRTPVVFSRRGVGRWRECMEALKPLLNKDQCRDVPECSMNGAYQPELNATASDFYGFSEYWYSLNDVLRLGGLYDFNKLEKEASDYCNIQWSTVLERQRKKLYDADTFRLKTQCFKSAWAATVLHDGFGFPRTWNHFRTVSKIKNQEVQWTLGAILYKLRYFPLRDIRRLREMQKKGGTLHQKPGWFSGLSQIVLLLCMAVVVLAGLRHCIYLQFGRKPGRIPRNKSMWGYMMLDTSESPRLDGIRIERDSYVY